MFEMIGIFFGVYAVVVGWVCVWWINRRSSDHDIVEFVRSGLLRADVDEASSAEDQLRSLRRTWAEMEREIENRQRTRLQKVVHWVVRKTTGIDLAAYKEMVQTGMKRSELLRMCLAGFMHESTSRFNTIKILVLIIGTVDTDVPVIQDFAAVKHVVSLIMVDLGYMEPIPFRDDLVLKMKKLFNDPVVGRAHMAFVFGWTLRKILAIKQVHKFVTSTLKEGNGVDSIDTTPSGSDGRPRRRVKRDDLDALATLESYECEDENEPVEAPADTSAVVPVVVKDVIDSSVQTLNMSSVKRKLQKAKPTGAVSQDAVELAPLPSKEASHGGTRVVLPVANLVKFLDKDDKFLGNGVVTQGRVWTVGHVYALAHMLVYDGIPLTVKGFGGVSVKHCPKYNDSVVSFTFPQVSMKKLRLCTDVLSSATQVHCLSFDHEQHVVTSGVVSVSSKEDGRNYYTVGTTTRPGSSGSPVFVQVDNTIQLVGLHLGSERGGNVVIGLVESDFRLSSS